MGFGGPPKAALWPSALVPYELEDGVPNDLAARIRSAMDKWSAVTPMRFVPRADQLAWVRFGVSSDPFSDVASAGMRSPGPQFVRVRQNASEGHVLHEIGHTIGLHHEHARPDRDSFIEIISDNIAAAGAKAYEFIRHNSVLLSERVIGTYDYESVMHYPPWMFQVAAGAETFRVLQSVVDVSQIGVWSSPSEGDIAAVQSLYPAV